MSQGWNAHSWWHWNGDGWGYGERAHRREAPLAACGARAALLHATWGSGALSLSLSLSLSPSMCALMCRERARPSHTTALGLVFLPSFLAFVVLDVFWITVVAKDLYSGLKPVLKPAPDAVAALLSWICIVAANYVFVLPRTGASKPAWHVIGQVSCWLAGCVRLFAVVLVLSLVWGSRGGTQMQGVIFQCWCMRTPHTSSSSPAAPHHRERCSASCSMARSTSPTVPWWSTGAGRSLGWTWCGGPLRAASWL